MIKRKIAISALVFLLSVNVLSLASCGGNKDTTHDAGSDGQVVTENKNDANDNNNSTDKNNGMTDGKNENGVVGEIVTDVKDGVGDIIDDVTGNGNGMGNGTGMNGVDGDINTLPNKDGGINARTHRIPRGK
jgi:hypothetical protein